MVGTTYTVAPIPPDPEHTTYVDAAPLRIGVEYRLLDDAELAAHYSGDDKIEVENAVGDRTIEDNGVSIHVEGIEDGHEYLRFDMFAVEPHYHYIHRSGERQTIVEFDRIALGDMLPWVVGVMGESGRLRAMLVEAGGEALLPRLDVDVLRACLPEVERLARQAEAALAGTSRPGS